MLVGADHGAFCGNQKVNVLIIGTAGTDAAYQIIPERRAEQRSHDGAVNRAEELEKTHGIDFA